MTLTEFFEQNRAAALAFSGGADSAYLLYAAVRSGCSVGAYYVKSEFQPEFELSDARRLAGALGVPLRIVPLSALEDPEIRANGPRRCYFCKKRMLGVLCRQAAADGFPLVLDGTNASDAAEARPGMQALRELGIRSPLRECGLTKDAVRRLSREAGLFTWDKPAYACLATRVPAGTALTGEVLRITERAEAALAALGFRDFRIRRVGDTARLQVREAQLPLLLERREEILAQLRNDYGAITLDLEVRK